jgi:TolB-like protein/DNA-binding winged helix-turn-helix (wHTH) protein
MEAHVTPQRFAGGSFDALRGELRVGGHSARLRPRSAAVLALLLAERGRVVSRHELMRQVWPDAVVTDDSLAQCIKEIRRALGPAAERIRTLPRVGYAFADVEEGDSHAAPETAGDTSGDDEPSAPAPPPAVGQPPPPALAPLASPAGMGPGVPAPDAVEKLPPVARAARLRWLLGGFALALVALVLLGPAALPPQREAPRFSIAVLPLGGAGDSDRPDALADTLADALTSDLTRIPGTFVVARGAADAYRGRAVDARRVGRELGVRYVMEGRLHRSSGAPQLSLRLVDAQSGEVLWSAREEGVEAGAGLPRPGLTARLARALQLVLLMDDAAQAGRHPSVTPQEALGLFAAQQRENPDSPAAWLWAAQAHLRLGDYASAVAEAELSLRLTPPDDPEAALSYSVLSRARLFAGDAAGALAAAETAMASPGPNRYAPLLVAAACMQLGDTARARDVMEKFLKRNPAATVETLKSRRGGLVAGDSPAEQRYYALLAEAGLPTH